MLKKGILCIAVLLVFTVTLAGVGFAGNKAGPPLKILLVGYGWYRGIPEGQINNAETIARALDNAMIEARDEHGGVVALGKVYSIVVPVTWSGAMPPVYAAIESLNPDIVVGLGTSPGATGLRPEPCGANWASGWDANPQNPSQEECRNGPIEQGGPPYRCGTLPYIEMVREMSRDGIPSYKGKNTPFSPPNPITCPTPPPSLDPQPTATTGWYLCNFMTYLLPKYIEENGLDIDVGFIHLPTRHEYAAKNPDAPDFEEKIEKAPGASMEMDRMIEGVRISLEECVWAKAQK